MNEKTAKILTSWLNVYKNEIDINPDSYELFQEIKWFLPDDYKGIIQDIEKSFKDANPEYDPLHVTYNFINTEKIRCSDCLTVFREDDKCPNCNGQNFEEVATEEFENMTYEEQQEAIIDSMNYASDNASYCGRG